MSVRISLYFGRASCQMTNRCLSMRSFAAWPWGVRDLPASRSGRPDASSLGGTTSGCCCCWGFPDWLLLLLSSVEDDDVPLAVTSSSRWRRARKRLRSNAQRTQKRTANTRHMQREGRGSPPRFLLYRMAIVGKNWPSNKKPFFFCFVRKQYLSFLSSFTLVRNDTYLGVYCAVHRFV